MKASSFMEHPAARQRQRLQFIAFLMFISLVLQQCLSASTSLFALALSENISKPGGFGLFIMYLGSFLAPYLVALLGCYFAKRLEVLFCAYNTGIVAGQFESKLHQSLDLKVAGFAHSVVGTELPKQSSAIVTGVYHLLSTGLNIVINALALAVAIDTQFLYAIFLGVLLSSIWALLNHNKVTDAIDQLQNASVQHTSLLSRSFSNFSSQNLYNAKIWLSKYKDIFGSFLNTSLRAEGISQGVAIVAAFLFALPSVATSIFVFLEHSHEQEKLLALALVMPRLFLLMNSAHFFISNIVDFRATLRLYQNCLRIFQGNSVSLPWEQDPGAIERKSSSEILKDRLSISKISIHGAQGGTLDLSELLKLTETARAPRRLTIRGENGAGKSTCLLLLKERLGARAQLISPALHLEFDSEHLGSSGQRLVGQIREVFAHAPCDWFLLDEWDAHLDSYWMETLSAEIDLLAQTKTVVEIRHRG